MTPAEVDDLAIVDFLILVDGIEARLKNREDAAEKGIALGI